MQVRPWIGAAVSAALMLSATGVLAQALNQTLPKPGVTKAEAEGVFVDAVVTGCLASREGSGRIADLPPEALAHFQTAADIDRKWSRAKAAQTPVWTTPVMGGLITITETSPDHCEVTGMQLPVDLTFKAVVLAARGHDVDFADLPFKPGYNPIGYNVERIANGVRYTVHLEGSEPGGLGHLDRMTAGHAFRFSLLSATVVRQPQDAKPLFR